MNERIFSLEEAVSFLPWLREELGTILTWYQDVEIRRARVRELIPETRKNGSESTGSQMSNDMEDVGELLKLIKEKIDLITGQGIIVRDPPHGLVDFPSERDGKAIYLCWMIDEEYLEFWHPRDTGVAGRQPL